MTAPHGAIIGSPAELELVNEIIGALRDAGFEIVSRDLIGRIRHYFHVNSKATDDLAQRYMTELDSLIMRDDPRAHSEKTP